MSHLDKAYIKNKLVVFWKPDLCIHCGHCAASLHKVFRPKEKPWINLDGASQEEIIKTVTACPSGALSFRIKEENEK